MSCLMYLCAYVVQIVFPFNLNFPFKTPLLAPQIYIYYLRKVKNQLLIKSVI
jgi:hypothetical protein